MPGVENLNDFCTEAQVVLGNLFVRGNSIRSAALASQILVDDGTQLTVANADVVQVPTNVLKYAC